MQQQQNKIPDLGWKAPVQQPLLDGVQPEARTRVVLGDAEKEQVENFLRHWHDMGHRLFNHQTMAAVMNRAGRFKFKATPANVKNAMVHLGFKVKLGNITDAEQALLDSYLSPVNLSAASAAPPPSSRRERLLELATTIAAATAEMQQMLAD